MVHDELLEVNDVLSTWWKCCFVDPKPSPSRCCCPATVTRPWRDVDRPLERRKGPETKTFSYVFIAFPLCHGLKRGESGIHEGGEGEFTPLTKDELRQVH